MTEIRIAKRSLRSVRLQAGVPRAFAAVLVLVLCAVGLRTILVGPQRAAAARTVVVARGDQGAEAFAEGFAHAYLTWDKDTPDAREAALAPFVSGDLGSDAGLRPAIGTDQTVAWTAVVEDRATGSNRLVTLVAQTSNDLIYLSVPIARSRQGFLSVTGPPAIVGPPASGPVASPPAENSVDDPALTTVVRRALANYLAGNRDNLAADLTPDAVVSLPTQRLHVITEAQPTWSAPGRRVAVVVTASDAAKSTWTLRYELEVLRTGRWFVRSVQVDPTFQGGS